MFALYRKVPYFHYALAFFVLIWLGILVLERTQKISSNQVMHLAAQIEFLIHTISIFFIFSIYFHSRLPDKRTYKWLFIANIFILINDLTYYFTVYFSNKYNLSSTFFIFILGYIPYLIWIFSIIFFLLSILKKNILSLFDFYKALPIFILINFLLAFLFFSSIENAFRFLSMENVSHILSFLCEFFIFDLALICLIYSEEKGFSFVLLGLIILISGDFFINYSFISQTSSFLHYGEMLWFLGLTGIMYGEAFIYYYHSNNITTWFKQKKSIKNNLAFWSFVTSILSFLFFFTISYFLSVLNKSSLLLLPLFVMMYSVIIVIVSIQMGKRYEQPFKKLTENISILMSNNKLHIDENFSIQEFVFLQKFIVEAFEVKEQTERAQQSLIDMAAQVAHDIRSPLTAINTVMFNLISIPERQRIMIRNATTRINDIANNLLSQSKLKTYTSIQPYNEEELNSELIYTILENIISEKRFEYYDSNIEINLEIASNAYHSFSPVYLSSFKRVLSNLINNSVEALNLDGLIKITLNSDDKQIKIAIEDNGCGIPNELLPKITERGFSYKKKNGGGYGLAYTKQYLEKTNAKMQIESIEGEKTNITLSLPHACPPLWFCDSITLNPDHTIFILDDDESIYDVWKAKFNEQNYLSLNYCSTSFELIEKNTHMCIPALYLIDFELLEENKNGLDVIEELKIEQNSILVTSCYEDWNMRDLCIKNKLKILPKPFIPHVYINKIY
jgi:signal transduction histidine kinase